MSTLAEPAIVALCHRRILRLNPDAPAKWGRMTAPQMICHLNDAFLVAAGEKYASPVGNPLQRTFLKWVAIRTPMQWPPNVQTRPELEQGLGGTPPTEWEADRARLLQSIDAFPNRQTFAAHPGFGNMSPRDWLIWGYRHIDHHLRQFGA
jgi:Protein of unknown function (DUF1569)